MSLDIVILGRIVLVIVSVLVILLVIRARMTNRLGNQFLGIMLFFWGGVLLIATRPEILDSVLNNTGLVNRAQFLLSVSVGVIIYMLAYQFKKSKSVLENLNYTIRKIALDNFAKEFKNEKSEIVIVIVAKNESKTIGDVIDRINSLNFPFSYKIIVVNDGSTDNTEEIVRKKDVLVLTHHINLGIGGATKTGYLACYYLNPQYVISLDADGQHDPRYISNMVTKLKEGADLVYGSRFSRKSQYQTNTIRFVGNKFYTNLVNRLGKNSITDVTSGFRGLRFEKLDSIYFIAETNFAIELALRATRNNLQIGEVPTVAKIRNNGKSQFFKIERFFLYNINAITQIFNAYFSKSPLPKIELFKKKNTKLSKNEILSSEELRF